MDRSIGRISQCPFCETANHTIADCFCAEAQRCRALREAVQAGRFGQDDLFSAEDRRLQFVSWLVEHGRICD